MSIWLKYMFITTASAALGVFPESGHATQDSELPPQIFEPGVISSGANDGAPTFSPDGKTLYFERTNSKWSAILESRLINGRWSHPTLAPFSGTNSDQQPAFSPDGRYLIFVSSRPVSTPASDGHRYVNHLYRVDRNGDAWSAPVALPREVNLSDRVFKPSVAANGDLYFMADTGTASPRKWKLYRARRTKQGYEPAQPLPFSRAGDVDPYIAPDQSFLVFSSDSRDPERGAFEHLYFVVRQGNGWSDAHPIRFVGDTEDADDGEAQVGPDGVTLYFTSSRTVAVDHNGGRDVALAAVERLSVWDNGNTNVWRLPVTAFLGGRPAAPLPPEAATTVSFPDAWLSADRGDFKPLEAIAGSRYRTAQILLAQARLAAARLDYQSLAHALQRLGQLTQVELRERAWASGVDAEAAFAQGDYAHAASAAARWRSELAALAVPDELSDAEQLAGISKLLAGSPRQRVVARQPEKLKTSRDAAGLRRANTRINGKEISAVIDTGANLSVVSRSAATRLGLQLVEGIGSVATGSRDSIPVSLGFAKDTQFAGITIANVVFIVLEDRLLTAPIPGYQIDAIIGFPVLRDLGRIRFGRDETITPEATVQMASTGASSLRLSGNDLFIDAEFNGIPTSILLDTGAAKSALSPIFSERYLHLFATLPSRTVRKAGAGGVTEQKVFSWPNVRVSIGVRDTLIPEMSVEADESKDVTAKNFGVLGQDVLGAFDSYTLDFDHMQFEIGQPIAEINQVPTSIQ